MVLDMRSSVVNSFSRGLSATSIYTKINPKNPKAEIL